MTKIIFLDVDGVLNKEASFGPNKTSLVLDPHCCSRFLTLVEETGAKVVLSSTWRYSDDAVQALRDMQILNNTHEDWATPQFLSSRPRGHEIASWLEDHPDITRFVILDDIPDMSVDQIPYFVQTNPVWGLASKDCRKARLILDYIPVETVVDETT
jgi:Swiss Army Knife RNA repair-like protein